MLHALVPVRGYSKHEDKNVNFIHKGSSGNDFRRESASDQEPSLMKGTASNQYYNYIRYIYCNL